MKKETGKAAMSKGKKSAKKHPKVRRMHIEPGANGGFVANHDNEPDMSDMMNGGIAGPSQSGPYPLQNAAALHAHIDEHMPEQSEETEDGSAGGGPGSV